MIKNNLVRGTSLGFFAASLAACGHLPIAKPAFEDMGEARAALPADWTLAPMSGDPAAIVADYSVFGDAQLTALVQEALENNRTLRAAMESVRQSEALLKQTRSAWWPSLQAAVGVNATDRDANGAIPGSSLSDEIYSFNATGAWNIDLTGDVSASVRASAAGLRSNEATFELARRQLSAQVARSYFIATEQQLQLEVDRRTLERAQATFRITQTRFDAGSVARDELVLGESALASAEDSVIATEASARAAIRALEVLLGRFPQNKLQVSATLPEPPQAPPLGLPELTIRARPDIVAAEYGIIQAYASTRVARLARWPQLDASLGLAVQNSEVNGTSNLFDLDGAAFTIGAALAQTLFDGGLISGRIEAAEAAQRGALERYGQTVIDAYADVLDALDQFGALASRARSLKAASDAARETLRLGELRYNEGSQSLLDLINVRDRSDLAESQLIANRRARLEQWVVLHLALGGNPVQAQPLATPASAADAQ